MSATLALHPEFHSSSVHQPRISVEVADDLPAVVLTLEAETGETFDDRDVARTLTPAEARALAAALWHFAGEAEA